MAFNAQVTTAQDSWGGKQLCTHVWMILLTTACVNKLVLDYIVLAYNYITATTCGKALIYSELTFEFYTYKRLGGTTFKAWTTTGLYHTVFNLDKRNN